MTYLIQIDNEIKEANPDEKAALDAHYADGKEQAKIDAIRAKLKAETLAKLGLTAEEIAALFS